MIAVGLTVLCGGFGFAVNCGWFALIGLCSVFGLICFLIVVVCVFLVGCWFFPVVLVVYELVLGWFVIVGC